MSMNDWARREIEIACREERIANFTEDGEWDYGVACYESALKAYESLCEDGHSGFSIKMTQSILNRLIDGLPLQPIMDNEEDWDDIGSRYGISNVDGLIEQYQCKRMSSLFKDVYEDGTVKYSDINRVVCVDVGNHDNTWSNGFVTNIINEMYPITMPYMPPNGRYRVYCEEILSDEKNGDFDSLKLSYLVRPDGICVSLDRYFKEGPGSCGWEEIDEAEWDARKLKHCMRLEELKRLRAEQDENFKEDI